MFSRTFPPGTVHVLSLPTGSDLYTEISEYAKANDIRAASVTYIGAVQRASVRYYDQATQESLEIEIDTPLEVVSGVGNISVQDGEPFLHTHATFSDRAGNAFGGHVIVGCPVFSIEATIHELDGEPPVRVVDETTGLSLWG